MHIKTILATSLILIIGLSGVSLADQDAVIKLSAEGVTINAQEADLKEVMIELARQADIPIRFVSEVDERVSIYLSNVSVQDAIAKLTPNNMSVFESHDNLDVLKELVVITWDDAANDNTASEYLPSGEPTPAISPQTVPDNIDTSLAQKRDDFINSAVHVTGEVKRPGVYEFKKNMTVAAAITAAGGLTPRASKKRIYLTHTANGLGQRRNINVDEVVKPGDTVYIDEGFY